MNFPAAADRPKAFKTGIAEGDARRSRQETVVQIRKTRKEEQLMKRRMGANHNASKGPATTDTANDEPAATDTAVQTHTVITAIAENMQVLNSFKSDPSSVPIDDVLDSVRNLRRMLSVERNPPVDQVIRAGALPYLVAFLTNDEYPVLQFEAAWALTNIASTSRTTDVANAPGAVEALVRLLYSPANDVKEQATWCIGNIAGDNVTFRDGLLRAPGLVEGIVAILQNPGSTSLAQNVAWTVSNLCRGKPVPDIGIVGVFIEPMVNLLRYTCDNDPSSSESNDVRTDIAWGLSYLSDGDEDRIQMVMSSGVVPLCMRIIEECPDNKSLLVPTVRCIGNFVTGSDTQTDAVLQAGFLRHAQTLLDHPSKAIKKDTCWIISNIAAGNKKQITALFEDFLPHGLVSKFIQLASESSWEVRKEAVWAICNILTCGTDRHMIYLVQEHCIKVLCDVLQVQQDVRLLLTVMDAFEKLLEADEEHERNYQLLMDECGGVDHLENLQEHPNNDIYEKASALILRYFGSDENEDQNLAPATEADGTFSFGFPSKQLFPEGNEVGSPKAGGFNFGGSTNFNMAV